MPLVSRYNSAVFQSLTSFDYTVAVVKDSFLNDTTWSLETSQENATGPSYWAWTKDGRVNPPDWNTTAIIAGMQKQAVNSSSPYLYANISTCFDTYNDYFSPQGNVLIYVKNQSLQSPPTNSLLLYVSVVPRYDDWPKNLWALQRDELTTSGALARDVKPGSVTQWSVGVAYYEVDHCLMQQPPYTEQRCQLQYSPAIMWVVCSFNLIKGLVVLTVWVSSETACRWPRMGKQRKPNHPTDPETVSREKHEKTPLYTLGDAIASFMRYPDGTTANMCLASRENFHEKRISRWFWDMVPKRMLERTPESTVVYEGRWKPRATQWRHAVSLRSWILFLGL